jgi:integration host factor subunit beta
MTKAELLARIATDHAHLRTGDPELIVEAVFGQITEALARGARVELRGFGAFTIKQRKARTGRNPRTGDAVPVPAKAVPFFRASNTLQRRINRRTRRD